MMIEEIGDAAGAVWRCLQDSGPQNMSSLKKKLKLDDKCLYVSLGWLAREDKIIFQQKNRAIVVALK